MKIGYARVSTDEQSDNAQIDALEAVGCSRIYREKYSGRSKSRPELERMIDTLRGGDVIVVQRLDRLGRSLKDLIELLDNFKSKQVQFISLNESIDTTTAVGELAFHMIGSIAQFERRLISERTKAGLAALTQASLITKVAVEQKANFEDIEKWTMNERGLIFYCQSFIDLRVEPKWLPSYLTPEQIRDELYGRVNLACQKHSEINFSQYALDHFSENSSIKLNAFFPGPIEGNIPPGDIPEDIRLNLEKSLSKNASFEAFTSLINLAQICKIDEKHVELAVSLLNNANHQLKATEDKKSIYQTLNGLAKVAGTVRSKKLAASVMILSRVYRDYLNVNAEPENIMAVGLVASAAFEDKDEWANYIGQWFSELSYLPLEQNAAVSLRSMLDQLCVLEPYLYYTCSRPLEILKCLIIE
tara:strand:- start:199 stop:1446 length:1248 start_codon:yes stop_codon:yes gene_type:complete